MLRKIFLSAAAGALLVPSLALASVPTDSSGTQANYAADVLDRFGVNTHIDFQKYGYENVSQTAADINYLGNGHIKILRDSPGNNNDLTWWPQVSSATGAKFDAYIGEGGPDIYSTELPVMRQMKAAGNYIMGYEGGNEEDDSYPVGLGNNQQQAAQFQPQVWQAGQADGVPVFNISFGAGWCTANDPSCTHGDYNTVGDLSQYTTYANAHTYPQYSPQSTGTFAQLNTAAKMAASTKPVAITEYGWTTNNPGSFGNVSPKTQAVYALEGLLDGYLLGDAYYFYYGLYDDGSGTFGLFTSSNQPKPAATALHNFFTLVGDTGSNTTSFGAGKLDYSLSGMPADTGNSGGKQLLMQKSDGSYWLALWNEQSINDVSGGDLSFVNTPVTLNLGATAQTINVYDPFVGTSPISSASNATSIQLSLPSHPILVEIMKSGSTVTSGSPSSSGSTPTGLTSVYLTPSVTSVTSGSPATLIWGAVGGTSCTGVNFTPNGPAGYIIVYPTQTTTYTVTCDSSVGTQSASATITVTGASSSGSSSAPSSSGFAAGDSVVTTSSLNVHLGPGTNQAVICTQPPNASGTLVGSPQLAKGYTWWNVNYTSGCSGWSAENYLSLTSSGGSGSTPATISIGGRVQTTTALNVRSNPSTSAAVQCTQAPGGQGTIIAGPQSANGYTWWQISYDNGCSGWSIQMYLTPLASTGSASGNSAAFSVGQTVTAFDLLRVRATPSLSGSVLGTENGNAQGSIIGGPQYADNYTWYDINWSNGTSGWSMQQYLTGGNAASSGGSLAQGNPNVSTGGYSTGATGSGGGIAVGGRISATVTVAVVQTPGSTSGTGSEAASSQGTVISGPQNVGDVNWWEIIWDNGLRGWAPENEITPATAVVTPPSTNTGSGTGTTGGTTSGSVGVNTGTGGGGIDNGTQPAARVADIMERFGANVYDQSNLNGTIFNGHGSQGDYSVQGTTDMINYLTGGSGMTMLAREWFMNTYSGGFDEKTWAENWMQQVSSNTGTKFTLVPIMNDSATLSGLQDVMQNSNSTDHYLAYVEGLNEPNGSASGHFTAADSKAFSASLYQIAHPLEYKTLGASSVIGYPLAGGYLGDYADSSSNVDINNLHIYPGYSPDFTYSGDPDLGSIGAVIDSVKNYDGNKPFMITEWQPTLYNAQGNNTDLNLQAYWAPITLVTSVAQWNVQGLIWWSLTDFNSSFPSSGLFGTDASNPRPAANVLRAMYQLTTDHGSDKHTFSPGTLNISVSGLPQGYGNIGAGTGGKYTGGHYLVAENSAGRYFIFLWNEQQQPGGASTPVTITFNGQKPSKVTEYNITDSPGSETPVNTVSGPVSNYVSNLDASFRIIAVDL